MEAFITLRSVIVPIDRANVDTDAILPKQFMKSIRRTGFGANLFDEWRYFDLGELGKEASLREPNPNFPLNQPRYSGAQIMLARENFGCGSSREHAPWALTAYGFRAVVSTSFADIFRNNALKNGLIPVIVGEATHKMLFDYVEEVPNAEFTVDLESQTLSFPNGSVTFPIDPFNKTCLLDGVDELGYIMGFEKEIAEFEANLS